MNSVFDNGNELDSVSCSYNVLLVELRILTINLIVN